MPSSINTFRIANDFESDYFQSQSEAFTNKKIIHLLGNIKRTPNDNIVFNIYYGLREDYNKNTTTKINVDEEGNYETFINLQDGDGKYYLTARLLLDDNSYDEINTFIELSSLKPSIELFQIENYDFVENDIKTNEKIYVFNKQTITNLNVSFVSYSDNFDHPRFYKLWLSSEEEPLNYLPLNKSKNFELINISNLSNGEYFVYLKIIDSFNNETFKRIKFNLNKKIPKLDLKYIKIVNKNYYINYENSKNPISLLVDIKSGLLIKNASYRIYKNNQILSPKSNDEFLKLNNSLTNQLKNSGIFYLDEFNLSEYFDLSNGNYNIEIFFTDSYNIEYVSNRISFISKNNKSNFYSNQINLNNPNSLILGYDNKIDFIFEDLFFNLDNKQILCYFENSKKEKIKINSFNTKWIAISENKYKTTLSFSLNNNHENYINNCFRYNIFYFEITNDYNEKSILSLPMVFKAKKNKIVLNKNFVYPKENELNPIINYINEDNSSAEFLINNESPNISIRSSIINEVDFGQYSDYKTHNNEIILLLNGKETVYKFTDEKDIYIDFELPDTTDILAHEDSSNLDEETYYFELYQTELKSNKSEKSITSQFYIRTFDSERFNYPLDTIYAYDLNDSKIIEISKDTKINNNSFLSLEYFNERFSTLNINKQKDFNINNYKEIEEFNCKLSNIKNKQKEIDFKFNIEFYKKITFFKDINLNKINNCYYDLKIELPYNDIEKDLLFYFDLNNEFETEVSFNNNSHDFEIITELDKKFIIFKNLKFNTNILNKENEIYYYVKYKNTPNISKFKIKYNLQINNKKVLITPIESFIRNNKIDFKIDNLLNEEIELKVNNKNKDFNIKNNILTVNTNDEIYNSFLFKIKENNNLFYYLPIITLKQIKDKILPNIETNSIFDTVTNFNNNLFKFNNINNNSIIKIETKIIKIINNNNELVNYNTGYSLIDIITKNNNFNYHFELSEEYQNKVFLIKFTINEYSIIKTICINNNKLKISNLKFKYDEILKNDLKNKISFDINSNEYSRYNILLNDKIISDEFECAVNSNNKFFIYDLITKEKELISDKIFKLNNDFTFKEEIKITRNILFDFFSVFRYEDRPHSVLDPYNYKQEDYFKYNIDNTVYFLKHEKKTIDIINNNDFYLDINGIVYKDKKINIDCSEDKELTIKLISPSGEIKFYKKIKIIVFVNSFDFKFDFKITKKSFYDLNKNNFKQFETRLVVSKPVYYYNFNLINLITPYESFKNSNFFKIRKINIDKFFYDLTLTTFYLDKRFNNYDNTKIDNLFVLLAYKYFNYYNGIEIPNKYSNSDLIQLVKKINIDYTELI